MQMLQICIGVGNAVMRRGSLEISTVMCLRDQSAPKSMHTSVTHAVFSEAMEGQLLVTQHLQHLLLHLANTSLMHIYNIVGMLVQRQVDFHKAKFINRF